MKITGNNDKKAASNKTRLLPSEERQFQGWRKTLPENLQTDDELYDLRGAYKAGMEPELVGKDYRMGSRNPETGVILKDPKHPTFKKGLEAELDYGYAPVAKNGKMHTLNLKEQIAPKHRKARSK